MLNYFASLSVGLINFFTVVGGGIGLFIGIYAIYYSWKLSREGEVITKAIEQNTNSIIQQTDSIQRHTEAIRKQTESIISHNKILRLDNIRNLFEISRDTRSHEFWHFRWRFETYDKLKVVVESIGEAPILDYGHCDLLIEAHSNGYDHVGFENRQSDFYFVKITNVVARENRVFPFKNGEVVACFYHEEDWFLSKGVDVFTSQKKYKCSMIGMGHNQFNYGEITVDKAVKYTRIKDS